MRLTDFCLSCFRSFSRVVPVFCEEPALKRRIFEKDGDLNEEHERKQNPKPTMTTKKISKKTQLPPKPVEVKVDVAPLPDISAEHPTVDAQPSADTQAPVSVTKAAKRAKPPKRGASPVKTAKPAKVAKKPLNFKVPADFRREFKTYASTHDLKLNQLLELAFESYRKQRGD